jgi:hypothetical protein
MQHYALRMVNRAHAAGDSDLEPTVIMEFLHHHADHPAHLKVSRP